MTQRDNEKVENYITNKQDERRIDYLKLTSIVTVYDINKAF
jgi:hypothetical protein